MFITYIVFDSSKSRPDTIFDLSHFSNLEIYVLKDFKEGVFSICTLTDQQFQLPSLVV